MFISLALQRTICLLALVCAKDGVWCLEQPGSSVLEFYPAWLYFLNACFQYYGVNSVPWWMQSFRLHQKSKTCSHHFSAASYILHWVSCASEVFRCGWWMSRYGAGSPKRQYAWSNGSAIKRLDIGWKRMKNKIETVRQYMDKQGKKRWHGTKALSHTESLSCFYAERNISTLMVLEYIGFIWIQYIITWQLASQGFIQQNLLMPSWSSGNHFWIQWSAAPSLIPCHRVLR